MKDLDFNDAISILQQELPIKLVISNPNRESEYRKVLIEKIKDIYHISKYTEKQVFNENISLDKLSAVLEDFLNLFKQINAFTKEYEYQIKLSKKGKVFMSKSKAQNHIAERKMQNKSKSRILAEGEVIPPLVDMGIFTQDGKIVSSMSDKYRQINRFIEIIDDELQDYSKKDITIVDFGCGKSYLTFILYYYLTVIRKLDVNMVGLDLKKEVIESCNRSAQKYGYENLHFLVGDIKDYVPTNKVDMVVSLHACDTATDYALFNAIKWHSKYIFSVPCCQHEVNKQINSKNFGILTKYGITKERISALFTDNIRCSLLEYSSYKVDLIEFIDIDHTPKNLLIRAVLSNISNEKKLSSLNECKNLMSEFNFKQKLYDLIVD